MIEPSETEFMILGQQMKTAVLFLREKLCHLTCIPKIQKNIVRILKEFIEPPHSLLQTIFFHTINSLPNFNFYFI